MGFLDWFLPDLFMWIVCIFFFVLGYRIGRAFEAFKRDYS